MINIKNLIIVVFLVFGVQTIAFTEPSPKQVTIRSKFIAGSKKGEEVLSAPSITTLLGQSAQISITSPRKNVPIDEKEKLQDGIRLNLKVLETSNGLLIKGPAVSNTNASMMAAELSPHIQVAPMTKGARNVR